MSENKMPTILDLYPDLNEPELAEAEHNLDRYLKVVLQIFERAESESNPQGDRLTAPNGTLRCIPPQSEASG